MPTPSTPVRKRFDYDSLDSADAIFVQQQTGAILSLMKRSAEGIREIGQRLIEVKKRLGHGRFGAWLSAEFEWDDRTARRFMSVADRFKTDKLSKINLAPSALYLLAAPSTPETAKKEAIARAEAGESITHRAAQEIKQKYTSTPSRSQTKSTVLSSATQSKPPEPETETPQPEPSAESEVSPEQVSSGSQAESRVTTPDPNFPRQRAIEPVRPRPEILAIRPPATAPELEAEVNTFESQPQPVAKPTTSFVQPSSWWKLGEKQLLYCGEPTSPRFQERLPEEVAFSLAFPPTENWKFDHLSTSVTTRLALSTPYFQDQDSQLFQNILKELLNLYTDSGDAVVFSFLPEAEIPLLAAELNCQSFSADPDPVRCEVVVTTWREKGLRAEKVSGLRF